MVIKTKYEIGEKVKTPNGVGTISEMHITDEGIKYFIKEFAWAFPEYRIKKLEV